MPTCPPYLGETSATLRALVPDTSAHHSRTSGDGPHKATPSAPCDHETEDAMPVLRKRREAPAHTYRSDPSRAERLTPQQLHAPLGRDETVRPRDGARSRPLRQKPPNRETPSDRLAPPKIPQRTTSHPEQTVERGEHDSQTSPEDGDARIDDEPLHHEAHRTSASATTTREPVLGAHTARVVEQTRKRDTVTERHFRSNLSHCTSWCVVGRTVSYEVNAFLLQYALNRLNILLILAGNTNVTLDLAVTVLKNFELERNTIQTKNDVPAR